MVVFVLIFLYCPLPPLGEGWDGGLKVFLHLSAPTLALPQRGRGKGMDSRLRGNDESMEEKGQALRGNDESMRWSDKGGG